VAKRIVIVFRHLFGDFGGLEACFGRFDHAQGGNCVGENVGFGVLVGNC